LTGHDERRIVAMRDRSRLAFGEFYRAVKTRTRRRPARHLKGVCLMTYWMYKDPQGQWRWTLEAANNRKIANSGEGYHNKEDCLQAIALVKGSANAPIYQR
jgi:uncharacterized protein